MQVVLGFQICFLISDETIIVPSIGTERKIVKKLIAVMLVALACGCTERAQQKGVFGLSDPALATKQDVEDLKNLINERFDSLEKPIDKSSPFSRN